MKSTILVFATVILSVTGKVRAVDVTGTHDAPNAEFGKDASYRLTGDAKFGWRTGSVLGDIDLNGHAFVIETGGGNKTVVSGAISGTGAVEWCGGGVPQVSLSLLNGTQPNTFKGVFTLAHGVLNLDKPDGVDAIPGDLVIGTKGNAVVKLEKSNQINDAAHVTLGASGISGLELQGNSEKIATLTMKSHGVIDMGGKPSTLSIGNSSSCPWDLTKTLTIAGFKPGQNKLVFGNDDQGLNKAQLARIGFDEPSGMPSGLYAAKIARDGSLGPDAMVSAIHPPFDVTRKAFESRAKLYESQGMANLTGAGSPLQDGQTIVFFGDSITWLNGYVGGIEKAIQVGVGTKGKTIRIVNRGINGGGVLALRDGSDKSAYPGSSAQKPFAEVIAAEKAAVAVVFIGINDVWWKKSSPEVFEQGLRDLAASAKTNKTRMVFVTLTVHGELPDGKNSDDPKIESYAELTRRVARDTGATLVDLRKAYIAYLKNHNARLRVDGTLYSKASGILTYDGVHPNATGNVLLANFISDGIFAELKK